MKFVAHRLLHSALILWGLATLVFFLFNLIPADPARMVLGQRTDQATLDAVRKELGLDQPLMRRYALYMNDLSPLSLYAQSPEQEATRKGWVMYQGTQLRLLLKWPYLRTSFQNRKPVSQIIAEKFPATAILALSSISLALVLGLGLGITGALYRDKWPDKLSLGLASMGMALPSFFMAILMAWIFGYLLHSWTGLQMTGSLYELDPWTGKRLALANVILPAVTLGIRPLSMITQITRSTLLSELQREYVLAARAKGLRASRVLWSHALRNCQIPILTAVSGWLASLMAGAFFVEWIFGWNGIGKATVEAMEASDLPVVMGLVLFMGLMFTCINLVVDLLYTRIDPRVKLS